MNIILIGMRGAGKSKVSRRLSALLKRDVLSSDLLIQYDNQAKSIPRIIEEHNGDWRAFRDMEYETLKKITALDGVIVDCGGGIIVDVDEAGREIFSQRKVDLLKASGKIIWLKGDIPRLARKTKGDARRPSLTESQSLEEVMYHRLPFYEATADYVIDIEGKSKSKLVNDVHDLIVKIL